MLELAHRLLERAALGADQVDRRHAHVGEEHLAEVAVGGHVLDGPHLDAGRVHRDDDLADAGVRRAVGAGAADEVAVVGYWAPKLVQIFWPLITQSSPSRTAWVFSEARSLPAFGSLMPMHQVVSPDRILGRNSACWSGRP